MEFHQAGSLDRAMAMYRDILAKDPKQADALHLLGAAEWQSGNLDEAEKLMRRAIAVWDKDAGYFADLGGVMATKKNFREAIKLYQTALKIDPINRIARDGIAEAYGAHGYELSRDGLWDEAEAAYLGLLKFRPGDANALNNLGEIHQHAGNRAKAQTIYDEALTLRPDHAIARYNRAICHLGLGDLTKGWEDLAGSVEGWLPIIDKRKNLPWFSLPLWDGSDPRGRKILIWGDQGIGDEVLFASMVPDLITRGALVTIECMDRLAPVFARSFPECKIIVRQDPPTIGADFDFQAPGLWLGHCLRPDFTYFTGREAFLKADATKTKTFRARYKAKGKKKITGIAWHSISGGRAEHRRMHLHQLVATLPHADTLYIDLQYGDRDVEVHEVHRAFPDFAFYKDLDVDQLRDMDSFAAQITACDDVVTIGNTTAHMAGALGVPAQVFLPLAGLTWYWFEKCPNSPWYPSLKLLRKEREGDWSAALAGLT